MIVFERASAPPSSAGYPECFTCLVILRTVPCRRAGIGLVYYHPVDDVCSGRESAIAVKSGLPKFSAYVLQAHSQGIDVALIV